MPKKPNITAKIAPDVLLQEFKSEEFYFFDLKISLFLEIRVPPKIKFNNAEALSNKGIKEKPIEMSYHKGSDFNRLFTLPSSLNRKSAIASPTTRRRRKPAMGKKKTSLNVMSFFGSPSRV